MEPQNPYAAPSTDLGSVVSGYGIGEIAPAHAEAVRRAHIGHEASVRSIGLLYLLGGVFGGFSLVSSLFSMLSLVGENNIVSTAVIASLVFLAGMTVLQLALGVGLRRLRRWAQVVASILTGLGLLYFAFVTVVLFVAGGAGLMEVIILSLMTVIPGYVLWLLVGEKGRMIFSQEYLAIREMTPEIKYRTSIIVKICVGLLIALILIGLIFAFVGAAIG